MYRPDAVREDTVLVPAFREVPIWIVIVPSSKYGRDGRVRSTPPASQASPSGEVFELSNAQRESTDSSSSLARSRHGDDIWRRLTDTSWPVLVT